MKRKKQPLPQGLVTAAIGLLIAKDGLVTMAGAMERHRGNCRCLICTELCVDIPGVLWAVKSGIDLIGVYGQFEVLPPEELPANWRERIQRLFGAAKPELTRLKKWSRSIDQSDTPKPKRGTINAKS